MAKKLLSFRKMATKIVVGGGGLMVAISCAGESAPVALTTEYQENPVGIDAEQPRLAWKLGADVVRQHAYQLETDGVAQPEVASADQIGVAWPGARLTTGSRHTWRVRIRDEAPSYKAWVNRGWTTLPEDFHDGSSRNHVMFGDFVAWSYQRLAGIRLAEYAGSTAAVPTGPNAFSQILLKPEPIPQLDWAKASVDTPYGLVSSEWFRRDGKIAYRFSVPPGTTAKLALPGRAERMLLPGCHDIVEDL